jgi:hypothetical protein
MTSSAANKPITEYLEKYVALYPRIQPQPDVSTLIHHVLKMYNSSPNIVRNKPISCFQKSYYNLMYPVCWFRSIVFMIMMDETHRKMLMEKEKEKEKKKEGSLQQHVDQLIIEMIDYIETGILKNPLMTLDKMPNGLFYLDQWTLGDQIYCITMDDVILYLLHLLNDSDYTQYPVNTIRGNYAMNYIIHMFPPPPSPSPSPPSETRFLSSLVTCQGRLKQNQFIQINVPDSQSPPETNRIILEYRSTWFLNAPEARLGLFAKLHGKVYTLSSLIMTSHISIKTYWEGAHEYCIYKCNRKFFQETSTSTIDEVDILSYALLGYELPYIMNKKLHFDINKSIRTGMYTQSLFTFSVEECTLVEFLAKLIKPIRIKGLPGLCGITSGNRVAPSSLGNKANLIATLMYFTKSVTLFGLSCPDSTFTIKFWSHINASTDTLMMLAYYDNKIVDIGSIPGISALQPLTIQQEMFARLNALPSSESNNLKSEIFKKVENFLQTGKITSMIARNVMQYDTLTSMFTVAFNKRDAALPASGGGGTKSHIVMRKNGKRYKVRANTTTQEKYIMSGQQRVYLHDIKGRYKYAA